MMHSMRRLKRMNKLVDGWLEDIGLTRKDLRYHFKWKGKKYFIPTFNLLWWIVSIVSVVGIGLLLYIFIVSLILVAPRP